MRIEETFYCVESIILSTHLFNDRKFLFIGTLCTFFNVLRSVAEAKEGTPIDANLTRLFQINPISQTRLIDIMKTYFNIFIDV